MRNKNLSLALVTSMIVSNAMNTKELWARPDKIYQLPELLATPITRDPWPSTLGRCPSRQRTSLIFWKYRHSWKAYIFHDIFSWHPGVVPPTRLPVVALNCAGCCHCPPEGEGGEAQCR